LDQEHNSFCNTDPLCNRGAQLAQKHQFLTIKMVRSAMDRHQHKRAYQPQITSFFSSGNSGASQHSTTQATLAPSIQASLLSVGMRIRKAVPEGYKTHKTTPLGSSSATKLNSSQSSPYSNDVMEDNLPPPRPRELQPFCGIHRVGGLAVQETLMDSVNGYDTVDAYGKNSGNFTSSQESNVSVVGEEGFNGRRSGQRTIGNMNKRQLDDDSEDEDVPSFSLDPEVPFNSLPSRYFAKPRSRRRKEPSHPRTFTTYVDVDFEEAPFLKPGDFEMGGT